MGDLSLLLQHLKQPEYVHVLLNPMPVYGLAVGILGVIAALVAKERRAILVSLLLVFVGAASAWPVASYGHRGYDRVYAMSGGDAQQWLDVHEERAEILVYLY